MEANFKKIIEGKIDFPIQKCIELDDRYVCLFDTWYKHNSSKKTTDEEYARNVIAFNKDANLIWSIPVGRKQYSDIKLDKKGDLWCCNNYGEQFRVDIKTGDILEHKSIDEKLEEKIITALKVDFHTYYIIDDIFVCIFRPGTARLPLNKFKSEFMSGNQVTLEERMRNIVGFDKEGHQIWRIQDVREVENHDEKSRLIGYDKIHLNDKWQLLAYDTFGEEYQIDPMTGSILNHKYMERDLIHKIKKQVKVNVEKYVEIDGIYICLFYFPKRKFFSILKYSRTERNRNVIAFDKNGNELWRIEDICITHNWPEKEKKVAPYVSISLDNGGNLWCFNPVGIGEIHRVDPKTGAILEHRWTK